MKNTGKMSAYKNYVCPVCFQQLPNCECEVNMPYTLLFIDEKIQEHIRLLNRKGYMTSGCCESHYDRENGTNIHISFTMLPKKEYLDTLPKGFKYYKPDAIICYISPKHTKAEFEEIKTQKLSELLDWVKSLPQYSGRK